MSPNWILVVIAVVQLGSALVVLQVKAEILERIDRLKDQLVEHYVLNTRYQDHVKTDEFLHDEMSKRVARLERVGA